MAATTSDGVFIDSLPYFDNDLSIHPNLQAQVDAEIARELKSQPPPNPANDPRLLPERPLFKVRPLFTTQPHDLIVHWLHWKGHQTIYQQKFLHN